MFRFLYAAALGTALLSAPIQMFEAGTVLAEDATPVKAEPSNTTVWPGGGWAVSTPEAEGIDPVAIRDLVADLKAGDYGLVDQFLLIRHGRVVADYRFPRDYRAVVEGFDNHPHAGVLDGTEADDQYNYDHPDWHPYYRNTDLHTLQSVTKSITSAALGIAVDKGLIDSVDMKVMPFFSAYDHDLSDPRKSAITLKDLLTMRSGIDWHTPGGYDNDEHSTVLLEDSDTWIQFILDRPMETDPGTVYDYNDGVSVLLGKIVREATGQRIDKWAEEHLFRPIGINSFYWKISPDGEADTEGGLYLKNHDLARIGYLFLRGGEWNGKRILSQKWVEDSVTPFVTGARPNKDGYGYQWWIPVHENGKARIYAGSGYGGQFLMVSPEHDIIVVFNGWNIHGEEVKQTFDVLEERIIPALTQP